MPDGVDSFLASLRRSGLLSKEQLDQTLRAVPAEERADADRLATQLVQLGKLSRFQARKLLQGATFGLCLGPYQIHTPLGKGGMGSVYLAADSRKSGRYVAIKVLPPKRARAEERLLARFQREMAMGQRVSHPHLAKTHEAGVWQGVYYIVMEYIPGQSLFRLVNSRGALTLPRTVRLSMEVASALEHAHAMGIIHRDLKPSNIMITPRDHAKVLDLGLALMEGEEGSVEVVGGKGYVVGSADYIAPEQSYDATNVDARADVYALGCSIYFALTGAAPFSTARGRDKLHAHRHDEASPLQWRNPDVPDPFAALIRRMMAKKPEERPPSMAAVRELLKPWRKSEEVQPLEQEGDSTYQTALAELKNQPLTETLADISIVEVNADGSPEAAATPPPADMLALAEIEGRLREMRRIGYLVAAFCGAMVILLGLLLLLILRL